MRSKTSKVLPEKTLKDRLEEPDSMQVPWHVHRFFGARSIDLAGPNASIGGTESDFGNLNELRVAVKWYVEQLGGKVEWDKNEKK